MSRKRFSQASARSSTCMNDKEQLTTEKNKNTEKKQNRANVTCFFAVHNRNVVFDPVNHLRRLGSHNVSIGIHSCFSQPVCRIEIPPVRWAERKISNFRTVFFDRFRNETNVGNFVLRLTRQVFAKVCATDTHVNKNAKNCCSSSIAKPLLPS